ncbi:MAG: hypothetical protein A3K46_03625 [Chloroflexi bacterium RBG_13_60_9]|nr:MAG: hypothetical protein A3K46_03625 [Chloroflexi bacterium RBG_13_60_9]
MGTDPQKLENRARLWGMTVTGMTLGIWRMVEESATSLAPQIGSQILEMMETGLGRKIDSDNPDEALRQLGRMFVEDIGYAAECRVEAAEKQIRVSLSKAVSMPEFDLLQQKGVKKLFSHPFMCTGVAVLARMGQKVRWTVEIDPAGGNETITYDLM